jgi:ribosomal protein S6
MKLVVSPKIRLYELTYLVPGSFASSEVAGVDESIAKLVKKYKLTLKSQEDWGRKPLAYMIRHSGKKNTEAYFKHLVLEGDAAQVPAFEADLYLQPSVIRHLLVIAEPEAVLVKAEELDLQDEAEELIQADELTEA